MFFLSFFSHSRKTKAPLGKHSRRGSFGPLFGFLLAFRPVCAPASGPDSCQPPGRPGSRGRAGENNIIMKLYSRRTLGAPPPLFNVHLPRPFLPEAGATNHACKDKRFTPSFSRYRFSQVHLSRQHHILPVLSSRIRHQQGRRG